MSGGSSTDIDDHRAGVGLYWGASSVVGVAQGLIVRRALARMRTA